MHNSRECKLSVDKRSWYGSSRSPHKRFVNRLCTCSTNTMSLLWWGDYITLLYSSMGRTYVTKAQTSNVTLRETKQRKIILARWWALTTLLVMWSENNVFWRILPFVEVVPPRHWSARRYFLSLLAGVRFAGLSHNNQARLMKLRDSTCDSKPPNHCRFASVPQRGAYTI